MKITIELDLDERQKKSLQHLCKHIGHSDVREHINSNADCYGTLQALHQIKEQLEKQ